MQLTQLKLEEKKPHKLAFTSAPESLHSNQTKKTSLYGALCLFFGMPVPSAIECVSGENKRNQLLSLAPSTIFSFNVRASD
jgi:hypothetical protein